MHCLVAAAYFRCCIKTFTMKKSFSLAIISLLYFVATDAQTTSYLWARNGSTSGDNAAGEFVAPMPDGGCVSAGEYSLSGLRFGPLHLFGVSHDIYIVRHDQNGQALWMKGILGGSYDYVHGMTSDYAGKTYIAGSFQSNYLTIDTVTIFNQSTPNQSFPTEDGFALVMDSTGNLLTTIKADSSRACTFTAIRTDKYNNIYLLGAYTDYIRFDSTFLQTSGSCMFVAGFRKTGELFLLRPVDVSGNAVGTALAVSTDGRLAISGLFYGDSLLTQVDTLINQNAGYPDGYLIVMDTAGYQKFVLHAQGNGEDRIHCASFAKDGSIWFVDESSAGLNIGGIAVNSNWGLVVWVHADTGGIILNHNQAEALSIQVKGFDVGPDGRVYISGKFSAFNIHSGAFTLQGNGGSTAYWLVTDPFGITSDMKVIANGNNIAATAICVNMQNDIFLTGWFTSMNSFSIGQDTLGSLTLPGTHSDPWLAKIRGVGSTTGGVTVAASLNGIHLYPNPASDGILHITLPPTLEAYTLQVLDMHGKLMLDNLTTTDTLNGLEVASLTPGSYLLRVMNKHTSVSKKFIVTR